MSLTTPVKPIIQSPSKVPAIEDVFHHIEGKCSDDIEALQRIVLQQINYGAELSKDLDSSSYTWREGDGRLTAIQWNDMHLQGRLSLRGLTELIRFDCSGNQLKSLDLKENGALTYLNCSYNQLSALELSENTALVALSCNDNQLTELKVDRNVRLIDLFCMGNQLTSLDVGLNKELTWLFCSGNRITSLDVSNCDREIKVYCDREIVISR